MAVNLADALEVLAPTGIPRVDYLVSDDGAGPFIAFWNTGTLGPQPTPAAIAAVTQGQVDAARVAKVRAAANARYEFATDIDGRGWRAIALMLLDEVNVIRASYPIPITSITRSGTVATVTTRWPHLLTGTPTVGIHGADVAAYNGAFAIAVTGATTFTYTVAGTPTTPAAGSLLCFPVTAAPALRTPAQALAAYKAKVNADA